MVKHDRQSRMEYMVGLKIIKVIQSALYIYCSKSIKASRAKKMSLRAGFGPRASSLRPLC